MCVCVCVCVCVRVYVCVCVCVCVCTTGSNTDFLRSTTSGTTRTDKFTLTFCYDTLQLKNKIVTRLVSHFVCHTPCCTTIALASSIRFKNSLESVCGGRGRGNWVSSVFRAHLRLLFILNDRGAHYDFFLRTVSECSKKLPRTSVILSILELGPCLVMDSYLA